MSCFNCFTSTAGIYRWFEFTILRWIAMTWTSCSAAPCRWWCLCCNRWLCWIALILIAIVSVVIWLVVEIIIVVVCLLIAIWCLLCNLVCIVGCLGNKACFDNCVSQGPCDGPVVEIDWEPPVGGGSGTTTEPGTGTGTGTGTGVGTGVGTGTGGTGTGAGTKPEGLLAARHVVVTDVGQLPALVEWKSLLGSFVPVRLELVGPGSEHSRTLQSAFDRYRDACGCREGKGGLVIAAALVLLTYLSDNPLASSLGSGAKVGVAVGVVLFGALAGKIYGVLRARSRLRRSIREVTRSLQPTWRMDHHAPIRP